MAALGLLRGASARIALARRATASAFVPHVLRVSGAAPARLGLPYSLRLASSDATAPTTDEPETEQGTERLISRHAERLHPSVIDHLAQRSIVKFTPIQEQSLEPVLEGQSILARSHTGTGKTLAFGLPLIERIAERRIPMRNKGPRPAVIVLCPTRELCRQITSELELVAHARAAADGEGNDDSGQRHAPRYVRQRQAPRLQLVSVYGGAPIERQIADLCRGVDILVATPGRTIDLLERRVLDFSDLEAVVLDEADEMLRMGFKEDVEEILQHSSRRTQDMQMLLFSATTPSWIHHLCREYMAEHKVVDVVGNTTVRTADTITHIGMRLPRNADDNVKAIALANIIKEHAPVDSHGTIVFTRTKHEARRLGESHEPTLQNAAVLHGDLSQSQRDREMARFRSGRAKVLIATDVAARGLDIPSVDLIVQLGLPSSTDSYVHRCGRTGRAGRPGVSVVVANNPPAGDEISFRDVERETGLRFDMTSLPSLRREVTPHFMRQLERSIFNVKGEDAASLAAATQDLLRRAERSVAPLPTPAPSEAADASGEDAGEAAAAAVPREPLQSLDAECQQALIARLLSFIIQQTSWSPPQPVVVDRRASSGGAFNRGGGGRNDRRSGDRRGGFGNSGNRYRSSNDGGSGTGGGNYRRSGNDGYRRGGSSGGDWNRGRSNGNARGNRSSNYRSNGGGSGGRRSFDASSRGSQTQ
eukprot:m.297849 g.297849  ORF g.297849 m.297849 type:complete len:705 (+) comp13722_c0_seq1:172-2286(+)